MSYELYQIKKYGDIFLPVYNEAPTCLRGEVFENNIDEQNRFENKMNDFFEIEIIENNNH